MEVTAPKGYEAQKMVVTYTKKYIYESPDLGKTVTRRELGSDHRKENKTVVPKTEACIKVPVDKDGKIIVPICPRRKVGGQCEMCWKKSATNHDLCHRCQAKVRHRFATAFGLPNHS
jgi:hypothetical protein